MQLRSGDMRPGHETTQEQTYRNVFPTFDELIGMDGHEEEDFVEWEKFLDDMPIPVHEVNRQRLGSNEAREGGVDRTMDQDRSPRMPHGNLSYQPTKLQRTESLPENRRRQPMPERRIVDRQMSFPMARSCSREDGTIFRMNSGSLSHGPAYKAAQSKLDNVALQRSDSGTPLVRPSTVTKLQACPQQLNQFVVSIVLTGFCITIRCNRELRRRLPFLCNARILLVREMARPASR